MAHNVKDINHSQFADDTLLLGGAGVQSAKNFKKELDIYLQISGSKINPQKSKIYCWNSPVEEIGRTSRVLEMESYQNWDSFTYLGVPIFKSAIKTKNWNPIVEKLKAKIQKWGARWLTLAGKLVLLKSVLSNIPIYQSSILLAPSSVISKIETLFKNFLWEGGKGNLKKPHLVSWGKVQKTYREGGLQVRSIHAQNLAMGTKILWQIVFGKPSWSKKVLWKKYFSGQRTCCLDKNPPNKIGSPIYKLCLKALAHFRSSLYWIPGNGKKINLWEDSILGEEPLGYNP